MAAWGSAGLGAASFVGATVPSRFSSTFVEGWLAVGPVALGRRRVDAGAGINTTERVDNAWLLGAHATYGPLMLVVGAGQSTVTGRNSNGEQSGTTTPIEEARAWTAQGELSVTLGHYIGLGLATFRTGGTTARSSGTFFIVQVGRLP